MRRILPAAVSVTIIGLSPSALAQFGNAWADFTKENSRLPSAVLSDGEEKDYAVGDLDGDGDPDLVIVRKQPFTSAGRRVNTLLMNEGGSLVDRTAQFATASDVAGDMGFLTPTNDRDVAISDVDGDGWLDVITATTISCGQTKAVSHPRIYRNLGLDTGGSWLGLLHEDARIPTFPNDPKFCAVAAGDVTGDGAPDLFFSHYTSGPCGGIDLNERLLINDGSGYFTDETSSRMTTIMTTSSFGTSAQVVDLNLDGANDIVRGESGEIAAIYNDPNNVGVFSVFEPIQTNSSPYHFAAGDLNNDGRPDVAFSDDGLDGYRLNTATDGFGRVVWSSPILFNFLVGGDDGFAGNDVIADLDGDGFLDVITCDVDVDIPGCSRRAHIYHNLGGAPGSSVQMREERQAAGSGWVGAVGIVTTDLTGTYDMAAADFTGNGLIDLVVGRCTGTHFFRNGDLPDTTATPYCFGTTCPCGNTDATAGCANSTGLGATLATSGSASVSANDLTLTASNLPANQFGIVYRGPNQVSAAFGDGIRCIGGQTVRYPVRMASGLGVLTEGPGVAGIGPAIQAGDTVNFQAWYRDPSGPCGSGFNLSHGLMIVFTP